MAIARPRRVFDLEQPRTAGMPVHESHRPGYFYALHRRHRDTYNPAVNGERSGASGVVTMMEHSGTHIDALCHQACGMELYGGVPADQVDSPAGFREHGVEKIAPIVTRGVLLDIAGFRGLPRLPDHEAVEAAELEACADWADVRPGNGDALLIRTGSGALWDQPEAYLRAAGMGRSASEWAANRQVVAVGADNMAWDPLDGRRDPETGVTLFGHVHLLVRHGIYIIENLNLEALAAERVYEFLLVVTPLKLVGATGSPVRPLALL